MNWVKEAESKLRDYAAKEQSLESVTERIAQLEGEMGCVRSATTDGTAARGGGNCREDVLLSNIAERTELERAKRETKDWVKWVNDALTALSDSERHVLNRFYIWNEKYAAERLCEELHLEKAQVYRRKSAALRHFAILLYGVTET